MDWIDRADSGTLDDRPVVYVSFGTVVELREPQVYHFKAKRKPKKRNES